MDDALHGRQTYAGAFESSRTGVDVEIHQTACAHTSYRNRLRCPSQTLPRRRFLLSRQPISISARERVRVNLIALAIRLTNTSLSIGRSPNVSGKRSDGPGNIAPLGVPLQVQEHLLDQLFQADRPLASFGAGDPGKGQEVVDQGAHPLRRLQDGFHVAQTLLIHHRGDVLLQQFRKSDHVAKRRP